MRFFCCFLIYRQVVAASDLNPGDVIMIEKPIACGPGKLLRAFINDVTKTSSNSLTHDKYWHKTSQPISVVPSLFNWALLILSDRRLSDRRYSEKDVNLTRA